MKKKLISTFTKIFMTALTVVLLMALFLNFSTLWSLREIKHGERISSGYFCAIITSGSMEPAISVNDLLIIKGMDSFQAGDIVTYVSPKGSLVTHRVVEALETGYITQGDANNILDVEIAADRVLGKAVLVVPGVGAVIDAVLSPSGVILLVCLVIFILLIRRLRRDKNERENEELQTALSHLQRYEGLVTQAKSLSCIFGFFDAPCSFIGDDARDAREFCTQFAPPGFCYGGQV